MESLLTLVVFIIIAGLSSWLKKRAQKSEDSSEWSPPPAAPPPRQTPAQSSTPQPRRALSWEEELRRLLQGESETPPPPPPVISQAPPVLAQPPASIRPERRPRTPMAPAPAQRSRTLAPSGRAVGPVPAPVRELKESSGLMKLQQAREEARRLEHQAQRQMELARQQIQQQAPGLDHSKAAVERLMARAMLRDRQSIRSAIVLSAILAPPKALEGQSAWTL